MACKTFSDSAQGLQSIYDEPPAAILIDASLSGISGVQLSRVLKHDPVIRKIPVILIIQSDLEPYVRLSEFSLLADGFVAESELESQLQPSLERLLKLFSGLTPDETSDLALLSQPFAQVNALSRMVQLLDQHITEADIMARFRKLYTLIPNITVLHHMLVSLLDTVLDYDGLVLFFNDKARLPRQLIVHLKEPEIVSKLDIDTLSEQLCQHFQSQSTEDYLFIEHHGKLINDEYIYSELSQLEHFEQQAIYPFFAEQLMVGGLVLLNRKPIRYDLIFPFPLIISEISQLMRLRRYYSEAQTLSISDPLTGLHSYQYFLTMLEREIQVARRLGNPLTLVNISIDEFRELNAQLGHQMGDSALKHVASTLLNNMRGMDIIGRASGRRIFMVLPNTTAEKALTVVQRMKQKIQEEAVHLNGEQIDISLTVGIVELQENDEGLSRFIERAECAVDEARKKGQNRVELLQ